MTEKFIRQKNKNHNRFIIIFYIYLIDFNWAYGTVFNIRKIYRKAVTICIIRVMNKFKDKMMRFMQGRYGSDQLARLTMYISFACLIVTIFGIIHLYIFWHSCCLYIYFRMLSRNISRRYNENQIYLKYRYKVIAKFNGFKARMRDRKTHRVFKCPGCSQKIRVPRGKGGLVSSVLSAELNL